MAHYNWDTNVVSFKDGDKCVCCAFAGGNINSKDIQHILDYYVNNNQFEISYGEVYLYDLDFNP